MVNVPKAAPDARFGHFARECREEEERCYKCHGSGHVARACPQEEDTCYNCNQVGHVVRDCPLGGSKTCYQCGGVGHVVRDCPKTGPGPAAPGRFKQRRMEDYVMAPMPKQGNNADFYDYK